MADRGMETTDSQRLTVTPASPAASDALPAPRYPRLRNVQDRRSPGFSDRGSRKASAVVAHRCRQARRGPACLASEAAARTAAQGSVPGTVLDRPWPRPLRIEPEKRIHKTRLGLGQPATLGLRVSRFRGFPLSGDLPASGTECRGCAPA